MRIIKKAIGKEPEILELEKTEVYSIFDSGMDRRKLYKSLYIVDRYQRDKSERNFNTSLIFPHTNIVNYYNDIYIIKKGLFRFKDIKRKEIEYILKLFKFDSSSIKTKKETIVDDIIKE